MPDSAGDLLASLLEASPLCFALVGPDGAPLVASHTFRDLTGPERPRKASDLLRGPIPGAGQVPEARPIEIDGRSFESWTIPAGANHLLVLVDRTAEAKLEDQMWEHQTRLSKVYSELSVRNQALSAALEELRTREEELSAVNRGLEERVREQIRELERSNKLRRYFSPEVASAIMEKEGLDLSTKKRVLTILFADVASFDELAAELESEEVIEILNEYRDEMTRIVFENGGTLDKFLTARVMVFFGDPIPHEDHPVRAVRAALRMRERVATLGRRWFHASAPVQMQIGVHTGYATVGNVGSEHRADYTVVGKNVAIAAALQQEAGPGQVLVSARTVEAVREMFETGSAAVSPKGAARATTAYNVLREKRRGLVEDDETLAGSPEKTAATISVQRVGPYAVLEKLGEGAMGIIYKALDQRLGRHVAIKLLSPELAANRTFLERFKREARALASLSSPHVAQIYMIGEHQGLLYFAMEYIDGPTLALVLQEEGTLELRRSIDLVTQVARGLEVAAEGGVIHRDVKPGNVMLTQKGLVKLTDFGLVKSLIGDPELTSCGVVLGTPTYMSPEQTLGEEVDFRSDIYSLGVTFYHMLAGKPPFLGKTAAELMAKHVNQPIPPHASLPPTVSDAAYEVLARMLAKKREDRHASYRELIEALAGC
ncbi:MAG: protein kinase [Planctomycetes bacterium]|nr:protein kinase [Planctomycetota bacterium]